MTYLVADDLPNAPAGDRFRALLARPGILQMPGAHNGQAALQAKAAGFDALNPVQWSAGSASYRQWKDKARGRLTLWGGGVNTQTTLPFGTVADVQREVRQVVPCLAADSGYVFCAIHNILAEVPPEKVLALYRTAKEHHA